MATGASGSAETSATVGEKLFYKIGEVSRLTGLPSYVLRFWESEFGFLRPQKTRGRQRKYTPKDIETLLQIKRMRYDKGFTIEGLKRRWHTREGGEVANQDLWHELDTELGWQDVQFWWIPGHSGDENNDKVDALAAAAAQ